MKALLLSAGIGSRLKPLTLHQPKCLLPINKKPILYYWLDLLEDEGVTDVLINTHHLSSQIEQAVSKRLNKINITLTYESELLGSAGTIFANKHFFDGEENFLLLYSDNITDVSLSSIINYHFSKKSIFTTYIYKTNNPKAKGIFEFDIKTGRVLSFEEKPQIPKTDYANAGIGVLNKRIFDYTSNQLPLDFGKSIMPLIVNEMSVMVTDKTIIDIGTLEDYKLAQDIWDKIH